MPMKLHRTLQTWLDELNEEVSLINSADLNHEANEHLITFGVSESELAVWGKESVNNFILGCRDVHASKTKSVPMQFYCWFDELDSQLRISTVSSMHNKLPFKCKLNICELPEMVQGLFNNDSGLYSTNAKLNVWCSGI
jgi:hypothetical protein